MPGLATPSYNTGFYSPRRGGRAAFPGLWRGCVGGCAPVLGATGSSLPDLSTGGGFGSIASYSSSAWSIVDGVPCVALDGTSQYLSPYATKATFSNQASLSLWVKLRNATPATTPLSGAWQTGTPTSGTKSHYPWTDGTAYLRTFRTARVDSISLSGGPTRTTWHHVCITSGPRGWELWLGGKRQFGTTQGTFDFVASAFRIGQTDDSLGSNSYTDGYYADVRLYNRELTANEIALLARRPGIAYERRRVAVKAPAGGAQSLTVPVVSVAATVITPTVSAAATLTVPVVSVASTVIAPPVSAVATLTVPVVTTTSTVIAPGVSGAVTLTVPAVTTTTSVIAPTITVSGTLTVPAVSVAATVIAPTISAGPVTLTVPVLAVASTLVAPSIYAPGIVLQSSGARFRVNTNTRFRVNTNSRFRLEAASI